MADRQVEQALQTLRLVVAAMIFGLVSFGAITVFLITGGTMTSRAELARVLLPILGLLVLAEIPVYVVLRRAVLAKLRRISDADSTEQIPTDQTIQSFTTLTIVGAALAEGPSLFGIIIFLLSGNWLAMVAPALGLLLLAALLPTRGKFDHFTSGATKPGWR